MSIILLRTTKRRQRRIDIQEGGLERQTYDYDLTASHSYEIWILTTDFGLVYLAIFVVLLLSTVFIFAGER